MDPKPSQPLGKKEEKERITQAAIQLSSGKILTGNNHEEIFTQNFSEYEEYFSFPNSGKMGFVTTTGRFVSREEAEEIAYKAGQIKEKIGRLSSADLKRV